MPVTRCDATHSVRAVATGNLSAMCGGKSCLGQTRRRCAATHCVAPCEVVFLRDYPSLLFKISFGCFALAVLFALSYALAPIVLGNSNESMGGDSLLSLFPVAAMLLILIAGLLGGIAQLLLVIEIATSKNDGQWKAIWIVVVIAFSIVGISVYMAGARKERKV